MACFQDSRPGIFLGTTFPRSCLQNVQRPSFPVNTSAVRSQIMSSSQLVLIVQVYLYQLGELVTHRDVLQSNNTDDNLLYSIILNIVLIQL